MDVLSNRQSLKSEEPSWFDIRAIVMDVDGTLTDGGIYLDDAGEEFKRYDARDGLGIAMWHRSSGKTAVITGRKGLALTHRMRELRIENVEQGATDKVAALNRIVLRLGVTAAQCAFVGDGIPDLAVMREVGVAVAVADASCEILAVAKITTVAKGGHGAIRELVEIILRGQGKWDALVAAYSADSPTIIH